MSSLDTAPAPCVPAPAASAMPLADQALLVLLADPARAAALAGQALVQAEAANDPAARSLAHLALSLAHLRGGDRSLGSDHLAHAERALAAAAQPDARVARASRQVRRVRAELLRHEGRHEDALDLLTPLRAELAGSADIDEFLALMSLGTVQGLVDRIDDALASYYAGLDLAQRLGVTSLEVNALNNLGAHQLDLHNLEDALPLLRRCLAGALEIGSRRQRIFAAGNLLQCLCAMGQAEEALALAREHLIPVIGPDDPPSLQRDEEIAEALLDNGLVDEARTYLMRDAQDDVLTNPTTALRAWLHARLLLAQGLPHEALRLCQAQQAAADDDAVMPLYRLRLCEITADTAAACGEHAAAYAALRKAHRLQDAVLGRAARARTISLQIAHELESTRRERDTAVDLAHRLEQVNAVLRSQVAANEALQQQLQALVMEDPLTGLHNRRHLFQAGPQWVERARRGGATLAVALIDLDHFKSVNDRHGHDAGDQVLRAFAAQLRRCLRSADLCCRYGGEEFVAVWPGLRADKAAARLQSLQREVAGLRFTGAAGESFGISFSAGVADVPADGQTLPALLAAADAALYRAKAAGRSRICRATADGGPGPADGGDGGLHG